MADTTCTTATSRPGIDVLVQRELAAHIEFGRFDQAGMGNGHRVQGAFKRADPEIEICAAREIPDADRIAARCRTG